MDLFELTEDEFKEYTKNVGLGIEENDQNEFNTKQIYKINNTIKYIKTINTKLNNIKELIIEKQYSAVCRECARIMPKINSCINNLNIVCTNLGFSNTTSNLNIITESVPVKIELNDDILHIRYFQLLPKRIKTVYGSQNEEYKNVQARFKNPIMDFFNDKKFFVYEEKVIIFFLHHFKNTHKLRDHDNFETKFLIDYIAINTLTDDSARYCAHYMDYILDDEDYSEIFVIPESKFIYFYQNISIK